jgi:hypothetical protein
VIREVGIAALKVRPQRSSDLVVAFANLDANEFIGVFFGVRRREPPRLCDPERHGFVAARDCPKAQILVVSELLFERVFAILECVGHDGLSHLAKCLAKPPRRDTAIPGLLAG